MNIHQKISLLALGLLTLPSCLHITEEPSDEVPAEEETSNVGDAGKDTHEPNDETERPSPSHNDGGVDTPNESSGDAGAEVDAPSGGDTTDSPAPEGDVDAGDDQPPPETEEELETASFFMPTVEPDNTVSPRIRVDANGGVHAVYAGYAGGGAYYAYCESGCDDYDNFDVIYFPTDGTVANAMLALTQDGKPRVLLSQYLDATFASCDSNCTDIESWETGVVLEHDSKQEITGEALALDEDGRPHFLAHTYRAYLGIAQEEPFTYHLSCNTEPCTDAGNWTNSQIATQIWEENNLLFDKDGKAHLGFVALDMEDKIVKERYSAYATCAGDCTREENWVGAGVAKAYTDNLEAINLTSGISLALTEDGHPRLLTLAKGDDGSKQLIYFECDERCEQGEFTGSILSTHEDINVGVDLTLDAEDHPRFVYTLDYNIFLASCDDEPCIAAESEWKLHTVEAGSEMPPDEIILYPNCSVAAWFLHSPVVDLDSNGNPIVGYQARDISGGVHNADPTKPDCVAGTDMTLTRMTRMVWD